MPRTINYRVGYPRPSSLTPSVLDSEPLVDTLKVDRAAVLVSDPVGLVDTAAGIQTSSPDDILLQSDFNSLTPGAPISLSDFRTAMGDANVSSSGNLANTSCVAVAGRGNVIRQSFAASTGAGITAFVDGPFAGTQLRKATIKYDIRFNGGTGWGAKVPGLGGVNANAAPGDATGGKSPVTTDAWSGRHMILRPGSGETSTDPDFANYMYHYLQHDLYGDDLLFGTGPAVGTWYTLETTYELNTVIAGVAQADGVLHSKWNGVTTTNRTDFKFVTKSDIYINYLYWHLFWGGADKNAWAPTVASSIDIDNLLITTPAA